MEQKKLTAVKPETYMLIRDIFNRGKKEPLRYRELQSDLIKLDQSGMFILSAGKEWKSFNYKKGLDALIRLGSVENVYKASVSWKGIDKKKAIDFILNNDEKGEYIYKAGCNIRGFDFKLGLDRMIEIGSSAVYVYKAGLEWDRFNHAKAFKYLMKTSRKYHNLSLEKWVKSNKPSSILESTVRRRDPGAIYREGAKYKNRDFEALLDELIYNEDRGTWILYAGEQWSEFNFKKGQEALSEFSIDLLFMAEKSWKQFDYVKGLDTLIEKDKDGMFIYRAGVEWDQFDYDKGLDALKNLDEKIHFIGIAGRDWEGYEFEKYFRALTSVKIKSSDNYSYYLTFASKEWKDFDPDKALEILAEDLDKNESYILGYCHKWKNFNFKKAVDLFIEKKRYRAVFLAGERWEDFDYKRALEFLKKENKFNYEIALKKWPISAREALKVSKSEKDKAKKIKDKKFVLENVIESEKEGKDTYLKGKKLGDFDNSDDLLDELIKKDETGYWIYHAGLEWPRANFNYKKAQEAVAKVDDYGSSLSDCGNSWPRFDYKKGFEDLIRKDKSGKFISNAGKKWKDFDYEKALDLLIERDKTGQWIYEAGTFWPKKEFNFDKALRSLVEKRKDKTVRNNAKDYVPYAKTYWPVFNSDIVLDGYDEDFEVFKKDLFNAGKYWKDFNHEKGLDILIKHRANGVIYLAGLEWKEFNHKKALEYLKKNNRKNYKKAMDNWPKTASEELGRIEKETKKIDKIEDRKLKLESVFMELSNGR